MRRFFKRKRSYLVTRRLAVPIQVLKPETPRLHSAFDFILKLSAVTAGVAALSFGGIVGYAVYKEIFKPAVFISNFTIPESLAEELGIDGKTLSVLLIDDINRITQGWRRGGPADPRSLRVDEIPELELPAPFVSFRSLTDFLREYVGRPPYRITGNVKKYGAAYVLTTRIARRGGDTMLISVPAGDLHDVLGLTAAMIIPYFKSEFYIFDACSCDSTDACLDLGDAYFRQGDHHKR